MLICVACGNGSFEYKIGPSKQGGTDYNIALFVSLNQPHSRLTESGVELRLREMGKTSGVEKVHPHKFRRTMATRAIEKGRMTSGGRQLCADRSGA